MGAKTEREMVKSFDQLLREAQYGGLTGDNVIEGLMKALTTGGIPVAGTSYGDLSALKLENLDATMTSVLFEQAHLKLFSAFPRVPSVQPLFQWIRRDRFGSARGSMGFAEGGAPSGSSSAWTRNQAQVKYVGTRGGYTHQTMVVGAMGGSFVDPVTEENRNRTLELLEKLERNILWGSSAIKDTGNVEVNFDGLVKQMEDGSLASSQIIDMEGKPMDFEKLEDIGEKFVTTGKLLNFANIRTWWTPFVLSDLAKLKFQAERIVLGGTLPAGYRTGVPLDGHQTQRGWFGFEDSIFMDAVENGGLLTADEAGIGISAPAAPTTAATSDAASKMEAGSYYYFTSAFNDKGETAATATAAAQAVAVGEKVTVTITKSTNAWGYRVYRGLLASGADAGWIGQVGQPAGANTTFVDLNKWRPGTGKGLLVNVFEPDIAFAQMSPLIKWPLAVANTTLEFLLLLYGVLVLKAQERAVLVKNIGRRT